MKILELDIHNVRGIPYLALKPNGKNLVVWGLNGSGKSAVVDAIDFLLTGHISRLIGEGTGGITLSKHGPHIDHEPKDAKVRALIKLDSVENPVEIERSMDKPLEVGITCDKESSECVEFVLSNAQRGQHVLARREILKYIHSEPGNRAKRIQELLNLSSVEHTRSALVNVQHKAEEELQAAQRSIKTAETAINQTVKQKQFSPQSILAFCNENRKTLGGKPLDEITSAIVSKDVRKPADSSNAIGMSNTQFEKAIEGISSGISQEQKETRATTNLHLAKTIKQLRADKDSLQASARLQLVQQGMKLVAADGSCPLCDTPWKSGELLRYLRQKTEKEKQIVEKNQIINSLASTIGSQSDQLISNLRTVRQAATKLEMAKENAVLSEWAKALEGLSAMMSNSLEKYPTVEKESELIANLLAPPGVDKALSAIKQAVKDKVPNLTPELNAWTSLVQVAENLKALEEAKARLSQSEMYLKRATILHDSFHIARDKIMGGLYDSVRNRFVELYRMLHDEDEGKFTAVLKPDGAALDFEVDFHGRGSYPPHALHSEGHQDSMGICLYLALAEKLNKRLIDLVILDDVVMSVDHEHRRQLCHVLSTAFPEKQFIITTHDKTWANQLKAEGLVKSKELVEFNNWDIDTGPQVSSDVVLWDKIGESLGKNEVPTASFYLRRGLEAFFCEACDALGASVRYNLHQRWELGDWCPAVLSQYRALLKQGKNAANSWSDDQALKKLEERERISASICVRSQAEQWNINEDVHYNHWKDSQRKDFYPVVEAFKDLCSLFECAKCGGKLRLTMNGKEEADVRCNCGNESWNLKQQRKA